jgi:hypothetical protein
MHIIKVSLLLFLTLTVMRLFSWLVGWLLFLATRRANLWTVCASNLVSWCAFFGLLLLNQVPGGSFDDYGALGFGAVVYAVFVVMDLKWCPWNRRSVFKSAASHPSS